MKDRVSSSLMAGMCTVCVTASVVAVAPEATKALTGPVALPVPTSDAGYLLTASSTLLNDLINVASLPVQNLATAWTDVAQLTYIINVVNAVNADLISGKWTSIQPDVQAILTKEQGYLTTLAALPATIVNTDVAAISKLAADLGLGGASSAATTSSARTATTLSATPTGSSLVSSSSTGALTAPSTLLNDLINVASLPVQNLATAWTDVAQLTYVINVVNAVNADLVSGKWTSIQPDVQAILTKEQGYLTTLAELPSTIVKTDTAAISKLAADLGVSTKSASATTLSAKVATTDTKTAGANTAAIKPTDIKTTDTSTTGAGTTGAGTTGASTTDNKITTLASKIKSAAPITTPKSPAASAPVNPSTAAPSISSSIHAIAGKLAGGKSATDSSASDTSGTSSSSSKSGASGSSDAKPAGRHRKS
ncbi:MULTISPECIES: hypothetical protein [unclassified Mycolicibacterium]|uniref:hypothetical protein n=1 Tax=unclassified Mycolicibacterium TaxID=2636767 RepID=UPI0012DC27A2|nr:MULTISPECIES: hypothetical protein [unclassified Mycolicibacterium]MUL85914.1 hypothetical protein [Mycolicibacterium sp. CBMA 329]MUL91682.1 hypothetical protein [Mycolicibacterium sp. CBMA 331]MUM03134.1 hypothetical protein [Mycolicibacterium sp. CBMA 334]MUM29520.1 hypothetical protein [Mycolicibacterium sp. CBMA 295]MUM41977.1 hypothetical protein [Mycolicibacterium sp. CBMA 247]